MGDEATPARLTTTFACPGATPQGTCALILLSDTKTSGAAVPPIITESTSPSFEDTGTELEMDSPEASPLPKIEMSEPGAMTEREPAALTTPLGWIVGVWARTAEPIRAKQPDNVRSRDPIAPFSQKSMGWGMAAPLF